MSRDARPAAARGEGPEVDAPPPPRGYWSDAPGWWTPPPPPSYAEDEEEVYFLPAPVAPPPRVYTMQELPDDVRAQLPRLTVSGATYSSNPAYRMVIVSGQVLHEGEQAAANTVLDKIEPHAVVLRFRDYRYTMPY